MGIEFKVGDRIKNKLGEELEFKAFDDSRDPYCLVFSNKKTGASPRTTVEGAYYTMSESPLDLDFSTYNYHLKESLPVATKQHASGLKLGDIVSNMMIGDMEVVGLIDTDKYPNIHYPVITANSEGLYYFTVSGLHNLACKSIAYDLLIEPQKIATFNN